MEPPQFDFQKLDFEEEIRPTEPTCITKVSKKINYQNFIEDSQQDKDGVVAQAVELYSRDSQIVTIIAQHQQQEESSPLLPNAPAPINMISSLSPKVPASQSRTIVRPLAPPKTAPTPGKKVAPVGAKKVFATPPPPPRALPLPPRRGTSSIVVSRMSILERDPHVIAALAHKMQRPTAATFSHAVSVADKPTGLSPSDAALSRCISLFRSIPRQNLAQLLVVVRSHQQSEISSVRALSSLREKPSLHSSGGGRIIHPHVSYLVKSAHEYPLHKQSILKQGSIHAAEVFPTISSDRALFTMKPVCFIMEDSLKCRLLISTDEVTFACFLLDCSSSRRLSEEFHFKVSVTTGTVAESRFNAAVFTINHNSLFASPTPIYLVFRVYNTINRVLVGWTACPISMLRSAPVTASSISSGSMVNKLSVPLFKSQLGLNDQEIIRSLSGIVKDDSSLVSSEGSFHFGADIFPRLTKKIADRLSTPQLTNLRPERQQQLSRLSLQVQDFSMPPAPKSDIQNMLFLYPASLFTQFTPIGSTVRVWVGVAHFSNQNRTLSLPEIEIAWGKALPCMFFPQEYAPLQNAESATIVVTKDTDALAKSIHRGLGSVNHVTDAAELKIQLPVPLSRTHRLIFKMIRLDHRGLDTDVIGYACARLYDSEMPIQDGYHCADVVLATQPPSQTEESRKLAKKSSSGFLISTEAPIDSTPPLLVFRTKLLSSVYPQSDKVIKLVQAATTLSDNNMGGLNIFTTSRGIISAFIALAQAADGIDPLSTAPHMLRAIQTARTAMRGAPLNQENNEMISFGGVRPAHRASTAQTPLKTHLISQDDSLEWFPLVFTSLLKRLLLECSAASPSNTSNISALPMTHALTQAFRQVAVILRSHEEQRLVSQNDVAIFQECYLNWVFVNEVSTLQPSSRAALYDAVMLGWLSVLRGDPAVFDSLNKSWEFFFELLRRGFVSNFSTQGRSLLGGGGLGLSPWSTGLLKALITELTCKMWLEHEASPIINMCLAELIRALRCFVPGAQRTVKDLVDTYLEALRVFEAEGSINDVSLRKWEFIRGAVLPQDAGFPHEGRSKARAKVDTLHIRLLSEEFRSTFRSADYSAKAVALSVTSTQAVRLVEDVSLTLLSSLNHGVKQKYLGHLFDMLHNVFQAGRTYFSSANDNPLAKQVSESLSTFILVSLNWLTADDIDPLVRKMFVDMRDEQTVLWVLHTARAALQSMHTRGLSGMCLREVRATILSILLLIFQHQETLLRSILVPCIRLLGDLMVADPQQRYDTCDHGCPELEKTLFSCIVFISAKFAASIFGAERGEESNLFLSEFIPRLIVICSFARRSVVNEALNCLGTLIMHDYHVSGESSRVLTTRAHIIKCLSDIPTTPSTDNPTIQWLEVDEFCSHIENCLQSLPPAIANMPPQLRQEVVLILQDTKSLVVNRHRITQRSGRIDQGHLVELYLDMLNVNRPSVEMRLNWIQATMALHTRAGNHEEAALCHLKVSCNIAQYLVIEGIVDPTVVFPKLRAVNHKAVHEELISPDRHQDFKEEVACSTLASLFTLDGFIRALSLTASCYNKAQLFAPSSLLNSVILDVLLLGGITHKLDLHAQHLAQTTKKLAIVEQAGTNLSPKYFWVRFDGSCFGVPTNSAFIYRHRYADPEAAAVSTEAEKENRLKESFKKLLQDQFMHISGKFGISFATHVDDLLQIRTLKLSVHPDAARGRIVVAPVSAFVPLDEINETLTQRQMENWQSSGVSLSAFVCDLRTEELHAHSQQICFEVEHSFPCMQTRLKVSSSQALRLSPETRAQSVLGDGLLKICEHVRQNVFAQASLIRVIIQVLRPKYPQDSAVFITEFHLHPNRFKPQSVQDYFKIASLVVSTLALCDEIVDFVKLKCAQETSSKRLLADVTEASECIRALRSMVLKISYREEHERSDATALTGILAALKKTERSLIMPYALAAIDKVNLLKLSASVDDTETL